MAYCYLSKIHLSTTGKYLVPPKQQRDRAGDRWEEQTVVSNRYGAIGMDPLGMFRELDRAWAHHCFSEFTRHSALRPLIHRTCRHLGLQELPQSELLELAAFAPSPCET